MHQIFDPKLAINFAIVVESGSITAGARALNVAQPWLSEQIRKLEQQVGERLLIRTSRRMDLTDAGKAFFDLAKDLQKANAAAQSFAQKTRLSADRLIRVGANQVTIGMQERVALIDTFMQRNPDVRLEINYAVAEEVIQQLSAGDLDIALVHTGGYTERRDLAHIGLGARFGHALVPLGDPLANRQTLELADFANRQIAVSPGRTDNSSRRVALEPLRAFGVEFIPAPDEDRNVIEHFAARLKVICFRWSLTHLPRQQLGSQMCIPLKDTPLQTEVGVLRRLSDGRSKINRFFFAAEEVRQSCRPLSENAPIALSGRAQQE